MESLRKQPSKLSQPVPNQHYDVHEQFGPGLGELDDDVSDYETGLQQHKRLENLYISARSAKRFQRDIVRGVEGYIVTGSHEIEIGTKLSEDSRKYGTENTCTGSSLSRVALNYSKARARVEKEHINLLTTLGSQVAEPLRAMVMGSSLEEAQHLARRYDRARQDAEAQVKEVSRRRANVWETNVVSNDIAKLEAAEWKLYELNKNKAKLGEEAAAALGAVEGQQQRLTVERLTAMLEAEHGYHQRVLQILDHLEEEMLFELQCIEGHADNINPSPPKYGETKGPFASQTYNWSAGEMDYFLVEVIHPYYAESDVELTLARGDYVVVRKVSGLGWAEGECKGKAGWFPFAYVERREYVPASKVLMMPFFV